MTTKSAKGERLATAAVLVYLLVTLIAVNLLY
jgi:hypothetical protein